jgi:hypothetical protein
MAHGMPRHLLPPSATREARLLLLARGLRAAIDGCASIVLPAYLLLLGLDALQVGLATAAKLLGSALLTLWLSASPGRDWRRAVCSWPLLVVAFIDTLNPSAGDVSVFPPLEQALLARNVAAPDRTALFARYSLMGALLSAAGILLAALPELVARGGVPLRTTFALNSSGNRAYPWTINFETAHAASPGQPMFRTATRMVSQWTRTKSASPLTVQSASSSSIRRASDAWR